MNQSEVTPKNIVLIGFMGSGKSTVGRQLHQRLGYPLSDMDQLIEQTIGKKITAIFKEEGESAFRDFETLKLLEIAKQTDTRHIISTGGGIVIRPQNRSLLRKLGYVVWLHAPRMSFTKEPPETVTGRSSTRKTPASASLPSWKNATHGMRKPPISRSIPQGWIPTRSPPESSRARDTFSPNPHERENCQSLGCGAGLR